MPSPQCVDRDHLVELITAAWRLKPRRNCARPAACNHPELANSRLAGGQLQVLGQPLRLPLPLGAVALLVLQASLITAYVEIDISGCMSRAWLC